jgi:hypothetical protein
MYSVDLLGTRHLAQTLDSMPETVREILREKVKALSIRLEQMVLSNIATRYKDSKGKLASAVSTFYEEEGFRIRGGVTIDTQIAPYARILDKGGAIPPHMIFPRNAKRLAFTGFQGDRVIVKRVSHPGAQLPAGHFMSDAYKSMTAETSLELKRAVIEGIRAKMRQG